MTRRDHPNWPPPPAGGTPPGGWQPDPAGDPTSAGRRVWSEGRRWLVRHKVALGVGAGTLLLVLCCGFGVSTLMGGVIGSPLGSSPRSEPSRSPAPPARAAVPKVVDLHLGEATTALDAAGFTAIRPVDASGRGRVVLNPQNWVVRSQTPAAGTTVPTSTAIVLRVAKPSDAAGTPTVTPGVVPEVVCLDLQAAQDALQEAGFRNLGSEDATGKGRRQLVDRNWVVVAQSARAGTRPPIVTRIVLGVVKFGEPTGTSRCNS